MSEVTKQDISELHKRVDKVVEHTTEIRVTVARIETTLKMAPKFPDRPCPDLVAVQKNFNSHVTDHKETVKMWQKPIVRTVVDLIKLTIVAVVTWLFVRNN